MKAARRPDEVKAQIQQDAFDGAPVEISSKARGAITGRLNTVFASGNKRVGGDEARHLVFAWLFERLGQQTEPGSDKVITGLSAKSLSNDQWWALSNWVGAWKDENGEWRERDEFPLEAALVLTESMKAYGNIPIGTPEDRSWSDTMSVYAVTQLGGVITNVKPEEVEEWFEHEETQMPEGYPAKFPPLFRRPTKGAEL